MISFKKNFGRFTSISKMDRKTLVKGIPIYRWDEVFTGGVEQTLTLLKLRLAAELSIPTSITNTEKLQVTMFLKGIISLLESNDFLPLSKLSCLARLDHDNTERLIESWLHDKTTFAISICDRTFFPSYAFDFSKKIHPLKIIGDVLRIFEFQKDHLSAALWFHSDNSYLGGQRPKDLLRLKPDAVILSARHEVSQDLHG